LSHIRGQWGKESEINEKEAKLIEEYLDNLRVGEVVCTKELFELLRGKVLRYNAMRFQRNANAIISTDNRFEKRFLYTEEYGKQRCWLKTKT
jgi:hypothetical protein